MRVWGKKGQFLALILLVTLVFSGCAHSGSQVQETLADQVELGIKQGCEWLDQKQGDFTQRNETTDQDAFLLAQAGRMTNEQKAAYLTALAEAGRAGSPLDKVTKWQDVIFGVIACGGDPQDIGGVNFVMKVVNYNLLNPDSQADFYVLTNLLLVLGNSDQSGSSAPQALEDLLATQNRDGALVDDWGTTLDATILGLQALALYDQPDNKKLTLAKDKMVVYLSQSQDKAGYFNFSGEPSLSSTAQGVIALVGLGIDPAKDQRFIVRDGDLLSGLLSLYNQELAKGDQADYFNVIQGLMGLVAYERMAEGKDYYYQVPVPSLQGLALETAAVPTALEPIDEVPEVALAIIGPEEVGAIFVGKVAYYEGDTVYSVLRRVAKGEKIPVESSGSDTQAYIEGISNLYQLDHGPTSGWLFSVDGTFPSQSAGGYKLTARQSIQWVYTLDGGKDVGAPAGSRQGK